MKTKAALTPYAFTLFLCFYHVMDLNFVWLWALRWTMLLCILCIFIAYCVGKYVNFWVAPYLGLTLVQGVLFASGRTWYPNDDVSLQQALRLDASITLFTVLIVFGAWCLLRAQDFFVERCLEVLSYLALTASILFFLTKDPTYEVPIFQNPSMGGSFIAMAMPFFTSPLPLVVMFVAILLTHATTPFLAGMVVLTLKFRKKMILPWCVAIAYALVHIEVLKGSGRYEVWAHVFKWWVSGHHVLFGTGIGTTRLITTLTRPLGELQWWWLHSDFFQVLIEQGVVGLLALLLIPFGAYRFIARKPREAQYLASFMVVMLANFPTHMPLHAFLMLLVSAIIM